MASSTETAKISTDTGTPTVTPTPTEPPSQGTVVLVTVLFFVFIFLFVFVCLVIIKRRRNQNLRRQYVSAARKSTGESTLEAEEDDAPSRRGGDDDDDVMVDGISHVFGPQARAPPPVTASSGDRLWQSVGRLFGSQVPRGAARVSTNANQATPSEGAASSGAPVVLNGRIQALYDEIMRQDDGAQDYGVLREETTPVATRRPDSNRKSFGQASEVSLELMDSGSFSGANPGGLDDNHLNVIVGKGPGAENARDSLFVDDADSFAEELESTAPTGVVEPLQFRETTTTTSTGFIANQEDPSKYYSIAYTEYYMDD